jgi:hypothetical protein
LPRHRKPNEQRQNTETVDVGSVPGEDLDASIDVPAPLRTWLQPTKARWERFWRSPARHVTVFSLDMDGLERLFTLYDERERAQRELRKARIVIGSTGQERQSGFYGVLSKIDAEIRQLEDRFGKSARSRLTLGMRVGDADAGGGAKPDSGPADQPGDRGDDHAPDPRLYLVHGRTG